MQPLSPPTGHPHLDVTKGPHTRYVQNEIPFPFSPCSLHTPYGKGSPACPKSPGSPLEHSWLLHPQFVHACINDISLMVVHLLPTSALFWALRISSWPASNNLFTVVPASNFLTPPNHVEYFNQRNISKTQSWLSSLFVSPVTFIIKFSSLTAPKILYLVALNGR